MTLIKACIIMALLNAFCLLCMGIFWLVLAIIYSHEILP